MKVGAVVATLKTFGSSKTLLFLPVNCLGYVFIFDMRAEFQVDWWYKTIVYNAYMYMPSVSL